MKKLLGGRQSSKAQPSLDNNSPAYAQNIYQQDPRNIQQQPIYRSTDLPPPSQQAPQAQDQQPAVGRSPSGRRASQPPIEQQRSHLSYIAPPNPQPVSAEDRVDYRLSTFAPAPQQNLPAQGQEKEERPRRGLRDRFLGSTKTDNQPGARGAGLNRQLSIRGNKGSPNPEKLQDDAQRQAFTRQNNSSLLLSPTEEDEDSPHNQFVIQQQRQYSGAPPPLPVKDDQSYPPEYYPPPGTTLQQISASQAFQQGELYLTPEQQQQLQQQLQQGQYIGYTEQQLQQLQSAQYQHYPPPQGPGPQGHLPQGAPAGYTYTTADQLQGQAVQPTLDDQAASSPQNPDQPQQELHQPQATRGAAQTNQEGSFLHAPQGSIHNASPPSPFPGQTSSEQQAAPQQPPSPTQSAPSPMPPPSRSGNNQRDAKPMQPPRDGAMGGHQPQGSQGQPFRGQGGQQGEGDAARPAERTFADMTEEDFERFMQLQKDNKELKEKYNKVKKYYFEKESQVHQLQNTIANQRMSVSRTSLDDSEYKNRFERLIGLIGQLSFSIRKSWKQVPEWMHRGVNKDALAAGAREMTGVGRAYISWWLYSELFERIFHPDLDPNLSVALKTIAANIRRCSPPVHSQEEDEALTTKISSWRLATIEGLSDQIRSPAAQQNRATMTRILNEKLVADISTYLTDPPPADLPGGVHMIIELAVNIASHLPMESREVFIFYCPPLSYFSPDDMSVETGIPPLTAAISPLNDSPSDSGADYVLVQDDASGGADKDDDQSSGGKDDAGGRRGGRGMLASIMTGDRGGKPGGPPGQGGPGGKAPPAQAGGGKAPNGSGRETPTGGQPLQLVPGQPPPQQQKEERVRLAIGLGVGIRNRSVLVKVPVYTTMI